MTLTIDTILEAWEQLKHFPKPAIAIVCAPYAAREVRRICGGYAPADCFALYGLPIYVKTGQVEPWRAFYDHDELRAYLREGEV